MGLEGVWSKVWREVVGVLEGLEGGLEGFEERFGWGLYGGWREFGGV